MSIVKSRPMRSERLDLLLHRREEEGAVVEAGERVEARGPQRLVPCVSLRARGRRGDVREQDERHRGEAHQASASGASGASSASSTPTSATLAAASRAMASGARPSVERAVPATTRKKPTKKGLLAPPVSAVRRARKTTAPMPSAGRRQRPSVDGGTRSMNRTTSSVPSASSVKIAASVSGQASVMATMTAALVR